jgi:hypothetical protein
MNIKKILANINSFPLLDLDTGSLDAADILATLYGKTLDFEAYSSDTKHVCENLPGLSVRIVFDFEHESDEDCFVRIASYDNKPFALVHKFGDRSDVRASVIDSVVFLELGKTIAQLFAELRLQAAMEELAREAGTPLEALSELGNGYLTWLSDESGAFSFDHPSSVYCGGFRRVPCKYVGVAQVDGALDIVSSIDGFVGGRGTDEADHVVMSTKDGASLKGDGRQIVFFLLPPEDALAEARKCTATKTAWKITGVLTRCVVRISQYEEGQLGAKSRIYVIHHTTVMKDFLKQYGDELQEGMFDPAGRNFDVV